MAQWDQEQRAQGTGTNTPHVHMAPPPPQVGVANEMQDELNGSVCEMELPCDAPISIVHNEVAEKTPG